MQVAVEDAVEHGPFGKGDEARTQERVGVDACFVHRLDVVEGEAAQPLHHQHAAGHEGRVRPGHDDRALVGERKDVRDVEHVLGLETEVELLDDGLGEELDDRRRVGEGGDRDPADELGRQPRHGGHVRVHQGRDVGPLHLDDDLFAGAEPGGVDLRDRRRRQRFFGELREERLEPGAEVVLDDLPDVGERLGRDLVPQLAELVHHLRREQAFAAGEDLPELHVARPELLERPPQPP